MLLHVLMVILWGFSPHPLRILIVQKMSYFCRPNPVDDALNIIVVSVQGREAFVLQISVMLLQTKGRGITVDMRQNMSPMKR